MLVRETFYIDKDVLEKLRKLSSITRVKRSDYIREGIDLVLQKYRKELKKKPQSRG
jgi:metal-responsive CopG/Arc/MetJ family transcriptional regulator